METVELSSSSEDDEDMYLNSVAKLKALKQMRPLSSRSNQKNEGEIQKNKEELKTNIHKESVKGKITNKKVKTNGNTPKRQSRRQRQSKRNLAESDSDLEVVSTEESIPSAENSFLIADNQGDDNAHNSEDENYEINIKVLWRSKEVHCLKIGRNEKFRQVFEYFANLERVPVDDVLITRKDKTVRKIDSPASIGLSVIDILEGGIVKKNPVAQKNEPDGDTCVIKVQTTSKKSVTVLVRKDENFETLLENCAQELNVEKSKIKVYFDGELVAISDTPDSLEIEDKACFDLRLSS